MPAEKKVDALFVTDENVSVCENLFVKTPRIREKKSVLKKTTENSPEKILTSPDVTEDENDSNFRYARFSVQPKNTSKPSKLKRTSSLRSRESRITDKSAKSSRISRSSSHFAESSFSKSSRKSTRKIQNTADITETCNIRPKIPSPKKRSRRLQSNSRSSDSNEEWKDGSSTPQSLKFNPETPRRSSRRIESIHENKNRSARKSPFVSSPKAKRAILRSVSKTPDNKSRKISFDDTDGSSSSEPAEISSKLPINAGIIRSVSKNTSSSSPSTSSRKSTLVSTPSRKSTLVSTPSRKSTLVSTPSRKSALVSQPNSVSVLPSTPKSTKPIDHKQLRTPATVRKKLTKQFASITRKTESDEESSSFSDLELSSDEFVPSSSDTGSTESEEDENNSAAVKSTQLSPIQERVAKLNQERFERKKTTDVDFSYKVDADDYFLSKCSKDPTSNNQLSALEITHLEEDEIRNLLRNAYTKHEPNKKFLIRKYKDEFSKWLFYLKESFNLLMYGLGSKIELLEYFHSEVLSMHDVLTIHGYFPRLPVKDVLNSLITDVLKINAPKNASEALPVIKSALNSRKSPVFVMIHNIDRLLSRQRRYQSILSKLASFPNLYMIVSIDHINAPLLWGNSMLTELNFIWLNVTTYQPYLNETSFENLIYLTETGTDFVSLSSLRNIFKPLAPRVKKIFRIIAKERLDNANNKQYKGMSYEDWYHCAKVEYLVNNITIFQVQLTELIDHSIIKLNDRQCIPILVKLDVLEKFYKEMYDNDEE